MGSNPQSDLDILKSQINAKTNESLESTRRMVQLAEESQRTGAQTLNALNEQGEKLNHIEQNLDQIKTDMDATNKELKKLHKVGGLFTLPWNKPKKAKTGSYESAGKKASKDKKSKAAPVASDKEGTTGKATSSSGNPFGDPPSSSSPGKGGYITRITNDAREDEMDENLHEVCNIVGNLRVMATEMGSTLDSQNEQLPRIIAKSWLKGIAHRAESLLNDLDSSAAQALGTDVSVHESHRTETVSASEPVSLRPSLSPSPPPRGISPSSQTLRGKKTNSSTRRDGLSGTGSNHARSSSMGTSVPGANVPADEDLLELLNAPATPKSPIMNVSPTKDLTTESLSDSIEEEHATVPDTKTESPSHSAKPTLSSSSSAASSPHPVVKSASISFPQKEVANQKDEQHQLLKQQQMENKLLRDELECLNQEVKGLLQRSQRAEEEARLLRRELESVQQSLLASESRGRELQESEERSREEKATLQSLCDALRQRVNECEQLIAEERRQRQEVQSQYQDTMQRNAHQASVHKETQLHVTEELRSQVKSLQSELQQLLEEKATWTQEKETLRCMQEEHEGRAAGLMSQLVSLQEKEREWRAQCAQMEERHAALEQEHREYRDKATKILQAKEKMIASLTSSNEAAAMPPHSPASTSSSSRGGDFFGADPSPTVSTPLQSASNVSQRQEEFNLLCEELERVRALLEQREVELVQFSQHSQQERDVARMKLSQVQQALATEKQLRTDCEEELSQVKRELHFLQERMAKQKNEFHDHLAQKDGEVEKLHGMLVHKQNQDASSHEELEDRINTLSQAVIQKQSHIDALKAEKHSLQERLNRSQTELHTLEQQHVSLAARASRLEHHLGQEMIHGTHIPLGEPQSSSMSSSSSSMSSAAAHGTVTFLRRFALRTFDKVSWRLGVYTRRYPMLRFFLFFYIIFLHMFVCLVLSSSSSTTASGGASGGSGPAIVPAVQPGH